MADTKDKPDELKTDAKGKEEEKKVESELKENELDDVAGGGGDTIFAQAKKARRLLKNQLRRVANKMNRIVPRTFQCARGLLLLSHQRLADSSKKPARNVR